MNEGEIPRSKKEESGMKKKRSQRGGSCGE